ncbi:hypothetical protein BCR43DRAFT_490054 [Syncephalastrum racemosum]|uniref:Uncharacterized protein n=1 Tax=Syncephalastrum racemosum TaxID=13706 RepID=A0A1X2HFA9_SYNRA|nr:hypothetical protein BCR43DRAFT_490054 [Syncephalastrum racemosum]
MHVRDACVFRECIRGQSKGIDACVRQLSDFSRVMMELKTKMILICNHLLAIHLFFYYFSQI